MRNEGKRTAAAVTCLVAALVLGTPVARAADAEPMAVIEATTQSVLGILRDATLKSEAKRSRIESIVFERVDFPTVSRLVLARNWRRLSKEQQEEFVREFRTHLSVTYGDNVDRYRDESVRLLGERQEPRGDRTVFTRVVPKDGGAEYALDYRLRQRDGQWLIIDIIVEGVSMVSNFRSQFQEILASGGPEKLLRLLHEKNAEGTPLKS